MCVSLARHFGKQARIENGIWHIARTYSSIAMTALQVSDHQRVAVVWFLMRGEGADDGAGRFFVSRLRFFVLL